MAGLDYINPATPDLIGVFAIGDLAYYPTDNFRVSVGGSYLLGDLSLHAAAEYQFDGLGMPLSLTGDARVHDSGDYTLTVGIKGYFGGDPAKSLIDRHRQDDPPNRALSLFAASGPLLFVTPSGGCTPSFSAEPLISTDCFPTNPEDFCIDNGYDDYNSENGEGYNYDS